MQIDISDKPYEFTSNKEVAFFLEGISTVLQPGDVELIVSKDVLENIKKQMGEVSKIESTGNMFTLIEK